MDRNTLTPPLALREIFSAQPPATPRPINAKTQLPLWTEPRVRRWWLLMLVVALTFLGYVADRLYARHTESQLIKTGVLMPATVIASATHGPGQPFLISDPVTMQVDWPGRPEEIDGFLSKPGVVRGTVLLHVDPGDHTRWTDRDEPTPLLDSLFVGLILLPLIPVLAAVAFLQQRQLQRIWQSGTANVAVVFDRRHSSIAPLSYAMRCSLRDGQSRDLFTVFVPRIGYALAKGDLIWVLVPKKSGKPLATLWMGAMAREGQGGQAGQAGTAS